jgi:hypothetical protein
MKVEIGDLVFCHTIGTKAGWRLNQIGIVIAGSKRNTRFRTFLSSGTYDEFTSKDVEKGSVEIIAKASGEKIALSKAIESIPNYNRIIEEATIMLSEGEQIARTFNQR